MHTSYIEAALCPSCVLLMASAPRHWTHPQSVPRGFLRLYMLALLARHSETGYSIMQTIDDKTEGAWRPGPGTVYPLLRGLVKEGLAVRLGSGAKEGTLEYVATEKGKKELEEKQRLLASAGRRERIMMRLFGDLLPAALLTSILVARSREGSELFREKIVQVPLPEREATLKEMKFVLESQLVWVDSLLSKKEALARAPRRRRQAASSP
jgi:DNA-binding PadR family transcriptional regulator